MSIRIKNWSQFQHFKDRKPPWVKLYRDLLDDMEWHQLDPKAAKALVMLWLIASEFDGELPEVKRLAFRLRMSEKETIEVVSKLTHWLEQDDIKTISTVYQGDGLETEGETEKRKSRDIPPDGVSDSVWQDFLKIRKAKKAPMTDTALDGIRREAQKAGLSLAQALQECCSRGWQGFKADWVLKDKPMNTITVPSSNDPDPALAKLDEDAKRAAPPPAEIREKMAQLKLLVKGTH